MRRKASPAAADSDTLHPRRPLQRRGPPGDLVAPAGGDALRQIRGYARRRPGH